MPSISPMLWFDGQAEEAANHYTAIFPNSKINNIARYGDSGPGPKGQAMVVNFELDGKTFNGLNGGPMFKFNESISFVVDCQNQAEVDYYWERLGDGGQFSRCGWLKDKFGLSWQIVPRQLSELASGPDAARTARVMGAMMRMDKIIVADLEAAAASAD